MQELTPIEARTADGWILRGDRGGQGSVVAVLGHAMMVDRRTLDRPAGNGLASELMRAGIEVLRYDARGHGESLPSADMGATWTYDDIVQRDVPAMIAGGRERAGSRPVVLLGHSLIGHAALIHAGLDPTETADAIIALAPNLWTPSLEASAVRRRAKGLLLGVWSAWTQARGYFDARQLGVGTDAEPAAYVEQFRTMWASDRLRSADGKFVYDTALARASVPVLAYASDGDRVLAHPDAVAAFVGRMTRAEVDLRRMRGPTAPGHAEMVTSERSRGLWQEIAGWILNRFG